MYSARDAGSNILIWLRRRLLLASDSAKCISDVRRRHWWHPVWIRCSQLHLFLRNMLWGKHRCERVAENKKLVNVIKELPPSFTNIDPAPEHARDTVSKMEKVSRFIRLFGVDLVEDNSKSESNSAPKRARLSDSDLSHKTEKDQTGHASTSCGNAPNSVGVSGHGIEHSMAHCLLCPNSKSCLPWMSGYLWEIGEIFDTTSRKSDHQWAVRYTSSENPREQCRIVVASVEILYGDLQLIVMQRMSTISLLYRIYHLSAKEFW